MAVVDEQQTKMARQVAPAMVVQRTQAELKICVPLMEQQSWPSEHRVCWLSIARHVVGSYPGTALAATVHQHEHHPDQSRCDTTYCRQAVPCCCREHGDSSSQS